MENKEEVIKEEQTTEKKQTLGDTINSIEKDMTDQLIKTYEESGKRFSTFAKVSSVVGVLNALIVGGNIALGNGLEAITNTGTCIGMVAYSVGNALLAKNAVKRAQRIKDSFDEETSLISAVKSKLAILKEKLEYAQITTYMYGVAGVGFTTTFISQLFRQEQNIPAEGFVVFSAALAGLVGVGTAVVAKKGISEIKQIKLDIKSTEKELEIAEGKAPEEEKIKAINDMNDAIRGQQETSKGRVLK